MRNILEMAGPTVLLRVAKNHVTTFLDGWAHLATINPPRVAEFERLLNDAVREYCAVNNVLDRTAALAIMRIANVGCGGEKHVAAFNEAMQEVGFSIPATHIDVLAYNDSSGVCIADMADLSGLICDPFHAVVVRNSLYQAATVDAIVESLLSVTVSGGVIVIEQIANYQGELVRKAAIRVQAAESRAAVVVSYSEVKAHNDWVAAHNTAVAAHARANLQRAALNEYGVTQVIIAKLTRRELVASGLTPVVVDSVTPLRLPILSHYVYNTAVLYQWVDIKYVGQSMRMAETGLQMFQNRMKQELRDLEANTFQSPDAQKIWNDIGSAMRPAEDNLRNFSGVVVTDDPVFGAGTYTLHVNKHFRFRIVNLEAGMSQLEFRLWVDSLEQRLIDARDHSTGLRLCTNANHVAGVISRAGTDGGRSARARRLRAVRAVCAYGKQHGFDWATFDDFMKAPPRVRAAALATLADFGTLPDDVKRGYAVVKKSSLFTGVYPAKAKTASGAFRASIMVDKTVFRLGTYVTERDAARAYDDASIMLRGVPENFLDCQSSAHLLDLDMDMDAKSKAVLAFLDEQCSVGFAGVGDDDCDDWSGDADSDDEGEPAARLGTTGNAGYTRVHATAKGNRTSRFTGVSSREGKAGFKAVTGYKGDLVLGTYNNEHSAACAYEDAQIMLGRKPVNFPDRQSGALPLDVASLSVAQVRDAVLAWVYALPDHTSQRGGGSGAGGGAAGSASDDASDDASDTDSDTDSEESGDEEEPDADDAPPGAPAAFCTPIVRQDGDNTCWAVSVLNLIARLQPLALAIAEAPDACPIIQALAKLLRDVVPELGAVFNPDGVCSPPSSSRR